MKFLVLLPSYNNATTLSEVLRTVIFETKALQQKGIAIDILLVNDGSTDETEKIITTVNGICVINHTSNKGKGEALRSGFLWAQKKGYDVALTMDTDGQHFATDIPKFIEMALKSDSIPLTIGARSWPPSAPTSSRFGRAFSNFWVWVETGYRAKDSQSGFRLYPLAQLPLADLQCAGFDFEIEILVRLLWRKIKLEHIPISCHYGQERVSHFKAGRDNWRLSLLHTKLCLRRLLLGATQSSNPNASRAGSPAIHFFLKRFGLNFVYGLLWVVVPCYFLTGWKHVRPNIHFHRTVSRCSFLRAIKDSFYTHLFFSATLIDRIATSMGLYKPEFTKNVCPEILRMHGGFVLIGAHFGDWTIAGAAFSDEKNVKIHILMDLSVSPDFQKFVVSLKSKNIAVIDVSSPSLGTILEIKNALDSNEIVCALADRTSPQSRTAAVSFFGKTAQFSLDPFEIALRLKRPIFAFHCTKSRLAPRQTLNLGVESIWDGSQPTTSHELMEKYAKYLQNAVAQAAHQWYNFFNIWKSAR